MTTWRTAISVRIATSILLLVFSGSALGDYLKIPVPPDIDKDEPGEFYDCWLITSANMLAGAGYGPNTDMQVNAETIYEQLKTEYPPPGT